MLIVISPAKSLNLDKIEDLDFSQPKFKKEALELNDILRTKSNTDLQKMMHISEKIAQSNVIWNNDFTNTYNLKNAKQAAFMFEGTVFKGLNIKDYSKEDISYAQDHLRIISGLYGLLKPLDLIHPYRLEMGSKIQVNGLKSLYQFWDNKISKTLDSDLKNHDHKVIFNLASNEYFKSIKLDSLKAEVVNIAFKELRGDKYKIIAFNAKKARGLMSRYILKNRIETTNDIKGFSDEGYLFNESLSDNHNLIFTK